MRNYIAPADVKAEEAEEAGVRWGAADVEAGLNRER